MKLEICKEKKKTNKLIFAVFFCNGKKRAKSSKYMSQHRKPPQILSDHEYWMLIDVSFIVKCLYISIYVQKIFHFYQTSLGRLSTVLLDTLHHCFHVRTARLQSGAHLHACNMGRICTLAIWDAFVCLQFGMHLDACKLERICTLTILEALNACNCNRIARLHKWMQYNDHCIR